MNKLSRKDIEMLEMLAKTQGSKDALEEYIKQHNKAVKAYKTYREAVVNGVEVDKVEKVVEVKRKFKAGDKVRVLDASFFSTTSNSRVGDIAEVVGYKSDNEEFTFPDEELYPVVVLDDYNFTAFFEESALELVEEKSPNELRAEVIKKAKEFVEENKNTVVKIESRYYVVNTSFITNASKRTVVALVKGVETRKVRSKGAAKYNPSDVFNEHIGKAIALGRALDKDVSEFENAPQPDAEVVGTISRTIFDYENGFHASDSVIWDDTNAQYGGVE